MEEEREETKLRVMKRITLDEKSAGTAATHLKTDKNCESKQGETNYVY